MPSWDTLGLGDVKKAAFAWQSQRNAGPWNEFAWAGPADGWVREVHGLLGTGAELVLVCIEAEVEKELHRRALAADLTAATAAWAGRAMRAFAELQINCLTVFGHNAINLTLRTLALDGRWQPAFAGMLGLSAEEFAPRSDDPKAWASLNRGACRATIRLSRQIGPGATSMAVCLRQLLDGPWSSVSKIRGQQYHRWRAESPGVDATDRHAPTTAERLARGDPVTFPGPRQPYTDGDIVSSAVIAESRRALHATATFMSEFIVTWQQAWTEAVASHRGS